MHTQTFSALQKKIGTFFICCLAALLLGCGGGGGGGGGNTPPPTNPPVNNPPAATITADAGEDRTINAGEVVELKAAGTGTITGYSWSRVEGPSVTLTAVDLNAGWFTFVAPSTGTEASITLTYRLTVTGANNASAQDTVTFTILRVNQAPTASAGTDQTVKGTTTVTLQGSGADTDGTIASYLWEQTEGDAVVLDNAQSAQASFTAPSTLEDISLSFRLTVTDNDGANAHADVSILVTPEDAPEVSFVFPPLSSIASGNSISAFGVASAVDSTLVSVTLNAGAGPVTATLGNDGNWRANGISLPSSNADIELEAVALDSLGRTGKSKVTLKHSSTTSHGTGSSWNTTKGLALNTQTNKAYVLTSGAQLSHVSIVPIDLNTGNREQAISNWSNADQGTQLAPPSHMIYHSHLNRFFVLTDHASDADGRALISVDLTTGERTLISGTSRGTGDLFEFPIALTQGSGSALFVSDNKASRILQVNAQTGNRVTLVDGETANHSIQGILSLAWNSSANRLYTSLNSSLGYILNINLNGVPATSTILSGDIGPGTGPSIGSASHDLIYDAAGNRLLVFTSSGDLVSVDINTNIRQTLVADLLFPQGPQRATGMAFDPQKQLIYVAARSLGFSELFVVDAETGAHVVLSRGQ